MPPRARKPKAQTGPAQPSFVENSHGRHSDDFYRTPGQVTAALCNELVLRGITPRTILDVGCGDGAIALVLRRSFPSVWIEGVDISDERARRSSLSGAYGWGHAQNGEHMGSVWNGDFVTCPWKDYDLIISNPPFKLALPFLRLALQRVRPGGHVAFLLISQWDQETVHDDERGKFLDLLRKPDGSEGYGKLRWKGRVDFRGNGKTDRVSHEWLVIGPGFEGQFVRVPRSPVATHEQLGLFRKGTTS